MPDLLALEQVMAYIEAHPKEWKQSTWGIQKVDCGTAYCFAGTWAAMNGGKFLFDAEQWRRHGVAHADDVQFGDDPPVPIPRWAIKTLGLDNGDADVLFDGGNSMEELREMVNHIAEGRSLRYIYRSSWAAEEDD